jgi:hypothetical protein
MCAHWCWVQAIVYNVDDLKEVVAGNKEARAQVGGCYLQVPAQCMQFEGHM